MLNLKFLRDMIFFFPNTMQVLIASRFLIATYRDQKNTFCVKVLSDC